MAAGHTPKRERERERNRIKEILHAAQREEGNGGKDFQPATHVNLHTNLDMKVGGHLFTV